jgi:hypothetical protein
MPCNQRPEILTTYQTQQPDTHNSDSDTAANSSSASGRSESGLSESWDVIQPLQNVSVGASFNTLIEEHKNNSIPY